jgi:hypothetical protein
MRTHNAPSPPGFEENHSNDVRLGLERDAVPNCISNSNSVFSVIDVGVGSTGFDIEVDG